LDATQQQPNNSVSKWKVSDSYKTINYNTPEVGGTLDPAHYADYADVLADYVLGYKAKMGVDLTVLSLQNEPNFQCTYESADWTAAQFDTFLGTLKTEFTKKGVFTQLPALKIMAPEFQSVKEDLVVPILNDSNVSALLGVVAVHQYDYTKSNASSYTTPTLTNSLAAGKRIWMTEFSTAAWTADTSITDGLVVARLVHGSGGWPVERLQLLVGVGQWQRLSRAVQWQPAQASLRRRPVQPLRST